MAEFLEFIRTGKVNGNKGGLTNRLHDAVSFAKRTGKWSAEFMRWEDELNDRYHKGFIKGQEQGIHQQQQYTIIEKERADAAEIRADKAEDRADNAEAEIARLRAEIATLTSGD